MKRIFVLILGVTLMVSCSLQFTKPVNGKILHPGHAMENRGSDVLPYLGQDLYYEANSGAVMLRPDLELKSMGGSEGAFTDGDGKVVTNILGTFELVTLPGQPALSLLHQKDVTAQSWTAETDDTFQNNQGFVFYWSKYATPTGSLSKITVWVGDFADRRLQITIYPGQKITVLDSSNTEITKDIPASFSAIDTPINFIVCFFVGKYVLIGYNGIANVLAFDCLENGTLTDQNNVSYPLIAGSETIPSSSFAVIASGAGVFGWKRLSFPTSGNLISPWYDLGKDNVPSASTIAKITKSIQPIGTSITGYFAGKPIEIEGTPGSGAKTGRLRYGFVLRGDGTNTPYLYSWRVKDPQTRTGSAGDPSTLSSDIISYQEDITGNKDGSFGDWTSRTMITCYNAYYDTIFTGRNAKMTLNINPGDGSVQRAVHYADTLEISRDAPGGLELEISAQSIVKRLKLTPILRPESFDDRGWRHGDLMGYLASLGGVILNAADYTADPLLPASGLSDRPNWQFNPGVTIWEAMNAVREYSGWLLYPDNNNELTYKPFPLSTDEPDFTIDMQDCLDLKYTIGDLARTRFMVLGQAGADDPAGRFKAGEGIFVYKTNSTLETELGESRPLWIFDPSLSSVDVVNNMTIQLYNWYSSLHKIISFRIPNFNGVDSAAKKYSSMTLNQVVTISDADIPDIDGVYLLTGIHISGDLAMLSANVELISLL